MSDLLQYHDFVVRLIAEGQGRYRVTVIDSPAGQVEEATVLPLPLLDAALRFGRPRSARHVAPCTAQNILTIEPQAIGEELFNALFPGTVGSILSESLGLVRSQPSGGLRIKLKVDLAAPSGLALQSLPWELLYWPAKDSFVNLNRFSPLVRFLEVPEPNIPHVLRSKLRVLAVLADPQGLPPLDLQRERREILSAWGYQRRVRLSFLEHGGLEELRQTLLRESFHVLHFMGHGEIDPGTGAGLLYFEGANGEPMAVTGGDLAEELKDIETLQLVFLNACETARTAEQATDNPFSGVAAALVKSGLAAVVALQLPMSDDAAITFSRVFYRRLAAGDPIDSAVVEGRLAVHRDHPESWEWAVPVLFLRAKDGRILRRQWGVGAWSSLICIALIALGSITLWPAAQPERLEINDNNIEVYDRDDRPMWTRNISGAIADAKLADLDGDDVPEVVLGIGNQGEDAGKIVVLDRKGQLSWSLDTAGQVPYKGGKSGRMGIRSLEVADLFDSGRKEIVSLSLDAHGWYPSRICVIEADGSLVGAYWHPGHLHHLRIASESLGKPLRILAAGVNNDLTRFFSGDGYPRGVLALDPRNVRGEAPPYLGGSGHGSQLWYVALLPKEVDVQFLDVVDREQDGSNEIAVWLENGSVLYFDFEGEWLGRALGDEARSVSTPYIVK